MTDVCAFRVCPSLLTAHVLQGVGPQGLLYQDAATTVQATDPPQAPCPLRLWSWLYLTATQVDDCRSLLMAAKRVVLAVDTDGPGLALAAELMRRWVGARSNCHWQAAVAR